jgi:hypothetical protein
MQLLDVPLTTTDNTSQASSNTLSPLELLRQTAAMALEGSARSPNDFSPIQAPVPRHAEETLTHLMSPQQPFRSVAEFDQSLRASGQKPTYVSPPMRLGQLGIQAAILSGGALLMFLVSGLFTVFAIAQRQDAVRDADRMLEKIELPEWHEKLAGNHSRQELTQMILAQRARDEAEMEELRASLSATERFVMRRLDRSPPGTVGTFEEEKERCDSLVRRANGESTDPAVSGQLPFDLRSTVEMILFWPIFWAIGAWIFRGGISHWVSGIMIVRRKGGKATRWQCALRVLMVWLPVSLFLVASVWIQAYHPGWVSLHAGLWWVAAILMVVHFFLGLRFPDRPVQDRVLDTVLIPR